VDEFDLALSLPDKADLLVSLRLTQSVNFLAKNMLFGFVGIGTFGMIDLVGSHVLLPSEEAELGDVYTVCFLFVIVFLLTLK
jgi:hypothetical protein